MTTLFDVSGIRARIFTLPNRPHFMIAPDLAEVYRTEPKYITRAVGRNSDRFPGDFCFPLEAEEIDQKWFQNGTTSQGFRADLQALAFTHAGALMLSAVLRTETAAQVSVIVHRAFAAMEAKALADVRALLAQVRGEAVHRDGPRFWTVQAAQYGWNFDQLYQNSPSSYSRPRLVKAVWQCLQLGLIEKEIVGTPWDRAPGGIGAPIMQPDLFGNV